MKQTERFIQQAAQALVFLFFFTTFEPCCLWASHSVNSANPSFASNTQCHQSSFLNSSHPEKHPCCEKDPCCSIQKDLQNGPWGIGFRRESKISSNIFYGKFASTHHVFVFNPPVRLGPEYLGETPFDQAAYFHLVPSHAPPGSSFLR